MGSLVLCHERHATHPYEITRIHCKIFTIEELCYYLCNNLYLIDYTIMNEQLCVWLDEELGMRLCDWISKTFTYFFIHDVIKKYNNIVILEFCHTFEKLCRLMSHLKVDKMLCHGFTVENAYSVNSRCQ